MARLSAISLDAAAALARRFGLACLATASLTARADELMLLPADMPLSYRGECASCHVPFPPSLLSSGSWRRVMSGLATHFGESAAIGEPARREIEDFLVRNGGGNRRFGARGESARLSSTLWFRRTHGEVRFAFRDPRVGSGANCEVCHPQAEDGRYTRIAPLARQLARKE